MIRLLSVSALLLLACNAAWAQKKAPAPAAVRVAYVSPAMPQPHPQGNATIFYDDFDRAPSEDARYLDVNRANGSFGWSANEGYGGRGGAMQCRFDKGQVSAGGLQVLFGKNPLGKGIRTQETFREIYWRVCVKHETGWEGNPAKLGRATCLAGTDWSQGFIAHVWGGKGDVLCIDPATGIRDGRKVTDRYNDFAHLQWLGLRQAQTPIFSSAESGRWVCVESHVRLNTPGRSDGIFELWVDGHLEASRTDLDWHGLWNDYAINAVFLENYWNEGSVKRQSRWFDNFAIATAPIGPITAANPPTLTRTPETGVAAWEAQASAAPDGKEIVWASRTAEGAAISLTIDAVHGAFLGSAAGKRQLTGGRPYWLRLRERDPSGVWSDWSRWHAPFCTSP